MPGFRLRYLIPMLVVSLGVISISAIVAISLFSQQQTMTSLLQENVRSQRSAVELEECLLDLIALENAKVEQVKVLHERVAELLLLIRANADQEKEAVLHSQMRTAFDKYLNHWHHLPPPNDPVHEEKRKIATVILEEEVLRPCQDYEHYNTLRVEQSAVEHEKILRRLAWGMGGIGVLGGVAGVILGFGVALSISKSIRRLQIQLRNAAGKLGADLPEIVLTGDGDFGQLHAEINQLSERIEQVVRDLQQRELEVLRAEQLAAVGQLAAGVAHEIRNPLTSIKMLVQAGQHDGAGMNGEDLRVIESEVRRMEKSLNTFLEFARPPKLQRKSVELKQLFDDVLGLIRMRSEKQKVAILREGSDALTVTADPEQLRQVLLNLCLNALDAMPSGGQLRVITRSTPSNVEIEVADSGPGISASMFPKLFQPFASTKETGLGLGLVISKRIIEDHGGRVNAANRPEGGASFFLRLPA